MARLNRLNTQFLSIVCIAMAMLAVIAIKPATAQGIKESTAIVDIQSLLQKSKAAISIQDQLKQQRESFQSEFSKIENDLKSQEKDILAQKDSLSAEEFSKRRDNFQEKLLTSRSIVQKRKNALDEALKEAMKKLRVEILNIVAEIAEENDYKLVMSRQNVIIVDKEIDITEQVLARLDKSLKKIDLNVRVN